MSIRYIDPVKDLGTKLLCVEKPARYTGGEYGIMAKKDALLRMVIAFPDLYEIGMSNQAFRIIYKHLNAVPGISCDRAFAPAPDFEALLQKEAVPLYGLDTGAALGDVDILCFTLGYELGITGVLAMLNSSGIPLRSAGREAGPLVIAGGPCVSNPLPYSLFFDAFWIGEAEAGFFELCKALLEEKKAGAGRADLFSIIASHPNVWTLGKRGVRRAVYAGFGGENAHSSASVFPVASIRTAQHHGSVEIMRGCPNGCRFCHAGIWYRPMRQKPAGCVIREVEELVAGGGYREISLSSLSSGDYCHITELVAALNARYKSRHVSFQLPSLRVSGFSLPVLEQLSQVRKSGLTFAVETPLEMWQLAINKTVKLEEVVSILKEAKRRGWRGAKFYFMIGLPLTMPDLPLETPDFPDEAEAIVDFIIEAARQSRGHFHINAGTFVPKAHTPYERAAQLSEENARLKLKHLVSRLKPLGHKVSVHDPFVSTIEGIIARGDERAGELVETAFHRGARLDAWSEYFAASIWRSLLEENRDFTDFILSEKPGEYTLPWSAVESGTNPAFLKAENNNSKQQILTSGCIQKCTHNCGICAGSTGIVYNSIQSEVQFDAVPEDPPAVIRRMVFSFQKTEHAVFVPHLGVIETFSMAFMRSGLAPLYTRGFNPHLKLEFASPAALGIVCLEEIACVEFPAPLNPGDFIIRLNGALPSGFAVTRAEQFAVPFGAKKHALPSLLYGFVYGDECIRAECEKKYRQNNTGGTFSVRNGILARNPVPDSGGPDLPEYTDYFSAYRRLYP